MADVTKFVVERRNWFRGEGDEGSRLWNSNGLCCLGFFGLACGFSRDAINGKPTPADVQKPIATDADASDWPEWLIDPSGLNSSECGRLMGINDDPRIEDDDRESQLAAIFAKHGVEVEFR